MYYVQNVKESRDAPIVLWWKVGDHGYTSDTAFAKEFTEMEISSMLSIAEGDKRAWPVEYIDNLGQAIIKEDDLDIEKGMEFELEKTFVHTGFNSHILFVGQMWQFWDCYACGNATASEPTRCEKCQSTNSFIFRHIWSAIRR